MPKKRRKAAKKTARKRHFKNAKKRILMMVNKIIPKKKRRKAAKKTARKRHLRNAQRGIKKIIKKIIPKKKGRKTDSDEETSFSGNMGDNITPSSCGDSYSTKILGECYDNNGTSNPDNCINACKGGPDLRTTYDCVKYTYKAETSNTDCNSIADAMSVFKWVKKDDA